MTTGAYRNSLGESRITTALLSRGSDDASRRAGAKWALGTIARYKLFAGRAQVALSDKDIKFYYGHPSFWGYYVRFLGLGEPRITNSLFMRASTNAARKAATQWTFGKLRALSVGSSAVSYALSLQPVTLTYTQAIAPSAAVSSVPSQASKRTRQRGQSVRHDVRWSYQPPRVHDPLLVASIGFRCTVHPVEMRTGVTPHEQRRRKTLRVLLITS